MKKNLLITHLIQTINKVVKINKNDYVSISNRNISLRNLLKIVIETDPTVKFQIFVKILIDISLAGIIKDIFKYKSTLQCSQPHKCLHKTEIPTRPVVFYFSVIAVNISRFLINKTVKCCYF